MNDDVLAVIISQIVIKLEKIYTLIEDENFDDLKREIENLREEIYTYGRRYKESIE